MHGHCHGSNNMKMYEIKVITSLPNLLFPLPREPIWELGVYSFLLLLRLTQIYIKYGVFFWGGGCFQTKMVCYLYCCASCFLVSKIRYQHFLSQYVKIHLTLFNGYKIFSKMDDSTRYHRLTSPNSWALTMHPGTYTSGFPGDSDSTCQCRRSRFDPWVRKIPWRRKWQPTPVFWSLRSYTVHRVEHNLATKTNKQKYILHVLYFH